jgi:hypothetical protein
VPRRALRRLTSVSDLVAIQGEHSRSQTSSRSHAIFSALSPTASPHSHARHPGVSAPTPCARDRTGRCPASESPAPMPLRDAPSRRRACARPTMLMPRVKPHDPRRNRCGRDEKERGPQRVGVARHGKTEGDLRDDREHGHDDADLRERRDATAEELELPPLGSHGLFFRCLRQRQAILSPLPHRSAHAVRFFRWESPSARKSATTRTRRLVCTSRLCLAIVPCASIRLALGTPHREADDSPAGSSRDSWRSAVRRSTQRQLADARVGLYGATRYFVALRATTQVDRARSLLGPPTSLLGEPVSFFLRSVTARG